MEQVMEAVVEQEELGFTLHQVVHQEHQLYLEMDQRHYQLQNKPIQLQLVVEQMVILVLDLKDQIQFFQQ